MLHVLGPWILADLGLAVVKLILACIQAGFVFSRAPLSGASSFSSGQGQGTNMATDVVIPVIYASCALALVVLCLFMLVVHFVELRKGGVGPAAWRMAVGAVWVSLGVTVLMLIAGAVTVAFNYTRPAHLFTNGSSAFNNAFTISFIVFAGISIVHQFVFWLYRRRVLSQGPRPKGRIGDDYERVGAEFSHSIRRANRVEDSAGAAGVGLRDEWDARDLDDDDYHHDGDEERECLPEMAAREPVSAYSRPLHAQQGSGLSAPYGGVRRQRSSAGYADYEDDEDDEYDGALAARGGFHQPYSSTAVPSHTRPLSHAHQASFSGGGYQDEPSFPTPQHAARAGLYQGATQASQGLEAHSREPTAISSHTDVQRQEAESLPQMTSMTTSHVRYDSQPVRTQYTGTTMLPAYSEQGYHSRGGSAPAPTAAGAQGEAQGIYAYPTYEPGHI